MQALALSTYEEEEQRQEELWVLVEQVHGLRLKNETTNTRESGELRVNGVTRSEE